MLVRVEFYGIPRQRAGVSHTDLQIPLALVTLRDVLLELARRFPKLADDCFEDERLKTEYIANRNGDQFMSANDGPLCDGDSLLILSADAGG